MVAAMVKAGSAEPAKYLPVLAKTEGSKPIPRNHASRCKGMLTNIALRSAVSTSQQGPENQAHPPWGRLALDETRCDEQNRTYPVCKGPVPLQ